MALAKRRNKLFIPEDERSGLLQCAHQLKNGRIILQKQQKNYFEITFRQVLKDSQILRRII